MGQFEIRDNFYLDGKPFRVISGSIHYFRVVPEYWRDRLEKLKAMGCNTVETYIAWNVHEPGKGVFDFDGGHDLVKFVRTAQELGLYVILRPSPYICAEWEFGGLPAWLLQEDGMRLRACHDSFLGHVREYYDRLFPLITPLQITQGGPVIMMQVENEYGYYGDDTRYMETMRDLMLERGVTVPLITSDGPFEESLSCGCIDGKQTGYTVYLSDILRPLVTKIFHMTDKFIVLSCLIPSSVYNKPALRMVCHVGKVVVYL